MPDISLIGGLFTTRSIDTASVDTNNISANLIQYGNSIAAINTNSITEYWTTPVIPLFKDTVDILTSLKVVAEKTTVDLSTYRLAPDLSNLTRLSTFVTSGADPVVTFTPTQSWYMS